MKFQAVCFPIGTVGLENSKTVTFKFPRAKNILAVLKGLYFKRRRSFYFQKCSVWFQKR